MEAGGCSLGWLGAAILALGAAGCASYHFTAAPHPPADLIRGDGSCSVTIYQPYEARLVANDRAVVGELEAAWGGPTSDVKRFEASIRKQVCAAGGIAVLARMDARRRYVGGTVYGYVPSPEPPCSVVETSTDRR